MDVESRLAQLESALQLLQDKDAIHDALMRLCRGLDRLDLDLVRTSIDLEGISESSEGPPDGPEDWRRSTLRNMVVLDPATRATSHFIGNWLIEVRGDSATSESYYRLNQVSVREGKTFLRTRAGRYLHRWARIDGQWRATDRMMVDDWSQLEEVTQAAPGSDRWTYGVRSREDPIYSL